MTEKEMVERWCPHMRVETRGTAFNVDYRGGKYKAMCIGPICMACTVTNPLSVKSGKDANYICELCNPIGAHYAIQSQSWR